MFWCNAIKWYGNYVVKVKGRFCYAIAFAFNGTKYACVATQSTQNCWIFKVIELFVKLFIRCIVYWPCAPTICLFFFSFFFPKFRWWVNIQCNYSHINIQIKIQSIYIYIYSVDMAFRSSKISQDGFSHELVIQKCRWCYEIW